MTDKYLNLATLKPIELLWGLVLLLMALSMGQDYIQSRWHHFGYYVSESLLYNCIWLPTIPLVLFSRGMFRTFNASTMLSKFVLALSIGTIMSVLHITLFSGFFVGISKMLFTPTHHFSGIFMSALTHQLGILFILYASLPWVHSTFFARRKTSDLQNSCRSIVLKKGGRRIRLPVDKIVTIQTQKPYIKIITDSQSFLDDRSLKSLEELLDPITFIRVHRSSIINTHYIKSLSSRQNGDYDVQLTNGLTIRCSRHYRRHWERILR